MKKTMLCALVAASLALPAVASATPLRPGPYVSGFIGVSAPPSIDATGAFDDRISFNPGLNVGATAGYDLGGFRLEGEISYKDNPVDTILDRNTGVRYTGVEGDIEATAFMVNAFFDLHNLTPITPYLGGGVGFAALHQSDTYDHFGNFFYAADDQVVFAYQAGGGLEVAINPQLSLDLGYRYFRTSKASFADTELELENHNATIGLRVKF